MPIWPPRWAGWPSSRSSVRTSRRRKRRGARRWTSCRSGAASPIGGSSMPAGCSKTSSAWPGWTGTSAPVWPRRTGSTERSGTCNRAGKYAEAIPSARQALAIRKAVLGERHPDTAPSLNNLALLLDGAGGLRRRPAPLRAGPGHLQGGAGRAPPRHRPKPEQPGGAAAGTRGTTPPPSPSTSRPWPSAKQVLGERHPDTAQSLNNLAYAAQCARGLRRRQAPLRAGPGHPQTGAGRAPPRHRHQPEQPGGAAAGAGGLRRRQAPLRAGPGHQQSRCSASATPTPPTA